MTHRRWSAFILDSWVWKHAFEQYDLVSPFRLAFSASPRRFLNVDPQPSQVSVTDALAYWHALEHASAIPGFLSARYDLGRVNSAPQWKHLTGTFVGNEETFSGT